MSNNNTQEKTSKGKKALNIALIVFQVVVVIVAIAFSISILLSTGYDSKTDFGKSSIRLMPVLTDSMNGDKEDSFKAGDLIIVKSAEKVDLSTLKVGDIVTYIGFVGTEQQFVTHRIVNIETDSQGNRIYETMGDAETSGIKTSLNEYEIKGVYVGKLAGVGSAVFWLQDPTHFFLVIMLPLILLLLYNAYLVVRIIIDAKLRKQKEQLAAATAQGNVSALDLEEIKRKAIEEYMQSSGISQQSAPAEEQTVSTENVSEAVEEQISESAETSPVTAEKEEIQDAVAEEKADDTVIVNAEEVSEEKKEDVPVENAAEAETVEEKPSEVAETDEKEAEIPERAEEKPSEGEQAKEEKKPAAKKTAVKKPAEKKPATAKKTTAEKKTSQVKAEAKKTTSTKKTTTTKKTTAKADGAAKKTAAKTATKKTPKADK